jgi:hypothetical protein
MFTAIVKQRFGSEFRFGPTDTRDEASRLARAWLEHAPKQSGIEVVGTRIERVEDEDES